MHFGVVRFERDVDPVMGIILSETREPEEWVTGNPIRAIPAEELIVCGFIQPAGSGFRYFGPDAEVLMDVELEQRQRRATRTTDMLQDQGMTILGNGGAVFMHRSQCAPHVYLDGVKITRLPRSTFGKDTTPRRASPMEEAAQALNIVHPANLAAVEIYRGPGEIPGEFLDSDARCGVILLWTRRGGMP